jgi:cell fate regulator YaaT (PSP1 superfamily)
MAERNQPGDSTVIHLDVPLAPSSIDDMRRLARERFKERVAHGGLGKGCECHDDVGDQRERGAADEPHPCVAGVRFIDSGQVYYFSTGDLSVEVDDWVVVETNRGREAARVVIAPSNIALSQISGELKPILRVLEAHDLAHMEQLRSESARAVRIFRDKIREHHLPMKPISAEYNFDGSQVTLHFSAPERVDFRELARDLASELHCRVELRQVGARDEARLLGGVGRCGRTLCCSTWLPMFPEINMGMAKSQDLSLNPSKVSGVCGRLLCCLSYENEQYKQMKAIMPKLGQRVETPGGTATVIALQILKDLVTVRLDADGTETQFTAVDLGFESPTSKKPRVIQSQAQAVPGEVSESEAELPIGQTASEGADQAPSKSSRRRRRRRKPRGDGSPADKSGEVQ